LLAVLGSCCDICWLTGPATPASAATPALSSCSGLTIASAWLGFAFTITFYVPRTLVAFSLVFVFVALGGVKQFARSVWLLGLGFTCVCVGEGFGIGRLGS
jgi:hypothetical protein